MKVFLLKDVERVGMSGEIIKVSDGYAQNFLIPRKLALEVTSQNEDSFKKRKVLITKREEVISSKQSMLAERIKSLKVIITRRVHDNNKLFGSITSADIAQALQELGISISKSQVLIDKSIKTTGNHEVTIKLTSRLTPTINVHVIPEKE